MKKLIAVAAFILAGTFAVNAQTPEASATTTTEQSATQATPAVNAVDMSQPAVKCATTSKSCCSHGNKTAAITNTSTTTAEAAAEEKKCESVGFGMSAAKPEAVVVNDEQPKE